MWIRDDEWANYVQPDSSIPLDICRKAFNRAISSDETYNNIFTTETKNDRGVYRHLKSVMTSGLKKRTVSFYYISSHGEVPHYPKEIKEWEPHQSQRSQTQS